MRAGLSHQAIHKIHDALFKSHATFSLDGQFARLPTKLNDLNDIRKPVCRSSGLLRDGASAPIENMTFLIARRRAKGRKEKTWESAFFSVTQKSRIDKIEDP